MTFVEVLAAVILIALALVPLMQLYPGLLEADQEAEIEMRVGMAAIRKMEEIITRLRDDISSVSSGAEACVDLPTCRLIWTIGTEAASATPGVGSLRTVAIRACFDTNGNLACDAGEVQVRHDAKVTSRP